MVGSDPLQLVSDYIETVQRARADGRTADWDAVRQFLAPDVVFRWPARGPTSRGGWF